MVVILYRKNYLCDQALQYVLLVDQSAFLLFNALRELLQLMVHTRDEMAVVSRRGRPRIEIQEKQLRFLVEASFRIEDIAAIFGCSRSTIQRRQRECGIRNSDFTTLSDVELVGSVVLLHPQCGERSVTGYLRSQGLHILRERIRQSIRRVDPLGVEARARCVLHRRRYNVEAPTHRRLP